MDKKHITWAAILYVVLLVAVFAAPRLVPVVVNPGDGIEIAAIRNRSAFDTREDSYAWNGADIKLYSDDHVTPKIYLVGDTGNTGVGGTLAVTGTSAFTGDAAFTSDASAYTVLATNAITIGTGSSGTLAVGGASTLTGTVTTIGDLSVGGNLVVTGGQSWSGQLVAGNGLKVTQNITQVSGSFILNSGTVSSTLGVAGIGTFSSQLAAANGLLVTQNITQVSGSTILNTVTVSGTLDVQGLVSSNAGNILQLNENTLVTGTLGVSGLASLTTQNTSGAAQFGSTGLFNDAVTMASIVITGSADLNGALDVAGIVSSADNDFRLNDNALISGTLTASGATDLNGTLGIAGISTFESEAYANNGLRITGNITQVSGSTILNSVNVSSTLAANTLSVTDNVTVTKNVTVTGWLGFGGTYMAVSTTVDYTDTQTLVVVANKTIYPVTAGGPTATLNDTVSISDGFYLGQMIIICNMDNVATHLVVIKDNANTDIGADLTLDSVGTSGDKGAMFWWDGTDWVYIG